jgi:tetratricopeptide (TPR) repeat protein
MAYRFRDRVRSPNTRLGIAATYFRAIGDPAGSLVFYDSISRLPHERPGGDMGIAYWALRKFDLSTRVYRRAIDSTHRYIVRQNAAFVASLLDEGNSAEAQREVAQLVRADAANPTTSQARAFVFAGLRNWDSLGVLGKSYLRLARTPADSARGFQWVGDAAIARGQFATFDSMTRLMATVVEKHGSSGDYLTGQLYRARLRATLAGDTARARAIADSGFAVAQLESLKPMDRPYVAMLLYLASVGEVQRGADVAREWSRTTPKEFRRRDSLNVLVGRGELALASGNAREALRLFRIADFRDCDVCFYPRYARAFDAIGERDSARVWFKKYATLVAPRHALDDIAELAHVYLRLGELYEERQDVNSAVDWYGRFTTLWATTDTPVLQARVRDVRGRVDRLQKQVSLK